MTKRRFRQSSRTVSPKRALDLLSLSGWIDVQDRGGLYGDTVTGNAPPTVEGLDADLPGGMGKRIISPDHMVETYVQDGILRVRETRNGRCLDQTFDEMATQDLWERLCFFAGLEP